MEKALQEKIARLQSLEQNVQQYQMKRQQFVQQVMEIESAIAELDQAPEAFKIVGNIMVRAHKDSLKKELDERREMANLRMKTLESQEEKVREKVESLKKEVMSNLKKE